MFGALAIMLLKESDVTATATALRISLVKKRSRGIANVQHLKTLIYFHCGGLDLNPSPAHS